MSTYQQLLERVAQAAHLTIEDVERRVEAKRAKLSGLVSKEGAAQIVAAELGINFEKEKVKLSDLSQDMKRANVLGKIVQIFPVRSYSKNGREGKVANLLIADEGGNVRLVLWDINHIALVEQGKFKEGDVVDVSNAMVRNGELHLSSFADIHISKEKLANVVSEKVFHNQSLKDGKPGFGIKTRAFIVQAFEPRYFEVCPQCGKRVNEGSCAVHGNVEGKKRALLNLVLDDGSESIRGVIFGENILKLGLNDEEIFSLEKYNQRKDDFLGEEKIFSGTLKNNTLYNTLEFSIESIENVVPETVIQEFERA